MRHEFNLLTDLVVVKIGVLGFDKWVIGLAVEYEGVRRTSDLRFLCLLHLRLFDSGNDDIVPKEKVGWCNPEDAADVVLKGCHGCRNQNTSVRSVQCLNVD